MSKDPYPIDDPGLPAGWLALFDPNSSRTYYWHQAKNETTYVRPGGPATSAQVCVACACVCVCVGLLFRQRFVVGRRRAARTHVHTNK